MTRLINVGGATFLTTQKSKIKATVWRQLSAFSKAKITNQTEQTEGSGTAQV